MTVISRAVCISDVMTSRVRTGEPDEPLLDLWRVMVNLKCHHIPIVEDGRPVGMVSTPDLVGIARKHGAKKIDAGLYGNETAGEVMSTDLETIHLSDSVELAIDRIGRGDIHALVVVDDDEKLAGIVTNHDLLYYLIS